MNYERPQSGDQRQNGEPTAAIDYYLHHPLRRPKVEIAEYVESQGIRTPHRFESVHDALASGQPFIIRSELPQDYDGVSDLVSSVVVDAEAKADAREEAEQHGYAVDWKEVERNDGNFVTIWKYQDILIAAAEKGMPSDEFEDALSRLSQWKLRLHCKLTGSNPQELGSTVSWSYWQLLPGENRTIVADSGHPNRYHIMTHTDGKENYTIVDGRDISYAGVQPQHSVQKAEAQQLIELYEAVRHLPRFHRPRGTLHCPIMEVQSIASNHYFLQTHRSVDATSASFTAQPIQQESVQATFVRGITPPDGVVIQAHVYRPPSHYPVTPEQGSFDVPELPVYAEIMARQRGMQFMRGQMREIERNIIQGHTGKSLLFKPNLFAQVSITDFNELFPDLDALTKKARRANRLATVPLHVVSDGREAFITR